MDSCSAETGVTLMNQTEEYGFVCMTARAHNRLETDMYMHVGAYVPRCPLCLTQLRHLRRTDVLSQTEPLL